MEETIITQFSDFDLGKELLEGIQSMRYEKPTAIQAQAIPKILQGKDLIACAQTGTGKTAAFLLPVMQKILRSPRGSVNTIILSPTRELALQIDQLAEGLSYFAGVSSIALYGGGDGNAWDVQRNALKQGVDMVIATPGRLISQLFTSEIDLSGLQHLVLDEADRMLDMGFYDDIMRIISKLPEKRQTLMFSATMPPKIRQLARNILNDPAEITLAVAKPAEGIRQLAYLVYDKQKDRLLDALLSNDQYKSILVFASTREKVKKLGVVLKRKGLDAEAFHSELKQDEREALMNRFKNAELPVLVGTDVISRGIDVEGIDLVINYDVPPDAEDYVHRIGRTARADKKGTAITFINDTDQQKFARIEELIENTIEKLNLPEGFEQGPVYNPSIKIRPKGKFGNRHFQRKKGRKK